MGSPTSQVSQSTQPQSKSGSASQFAPPTTAEQQGGSGKGMAAPGNQMNASEQAQQMAYAQRRQPSMGMPNNYLNTVGQPGNNGITQNSFGGKGKGNTANAPSGGSPLQQLSTQMLPQDLAQRQMGGYNQIENTNHPAAAAMASGGIG